MIREPILHPKTKLHLESYIKNPAHSLILSGPKGIGKSYIANWIAYNLGLSSIIISVEEGKKMIGIDQIQSLYTQTRSASGLCVFINSAELLTIDAQNALLKLLEEPPSNTYFVLATSSPDLLLQTVHSRSQVIAIYPPSINDITKALEKEFKNYKSDEIKSIALSLRGLPGALYEVLADKELMEQHQQSLENAKQFLSSNIETRLVMLSENAFSAQWCEQLLNNLALLTESLLKLKSSDKILVEKLIKQVDVINQTIDALKVNGNPKIHMTKLSIEL